MAANVMGLGVVAAIADGVASSMVTVDELAALLSPAVAVESSTGLVFGTRSVGLAFIFRQTMACPHQTLLHCSMLESTKSHAVLYQATASSKRW